MLVAEHADGSRGQAQPGALLGPQPGPAGTEDSQQVAVGEDQEIPLAVLHRGDRPVGPGADVGGLLAAGAASHVSRARREGLTRISPNSCPASVAASARAASRP